MGCEQALRLLSELQKKPRDSAGIVAQTDEHHRTGECVSMLQKVIQEG